MLGFLEAARYIVVALPVVVAEKPVPPGADRLRRLREVSPASSSLCYPCDRWTEHWDQSWNIRDMRCNFFFLLLVVTVTSFALRSNLSFALSVGVVVSKAGLD
jgi:hypothetical protein